MALDPMSIAATRVLLETVIDSESHAGILAVND
jgi:hypothetical protein